MLANVLRPHRQRKSGEVRSTGFASCPPLSLVKAPYGGQPAPSALMSVLTLNRIAFPSQPLRYLLGKASHVFSVSLLARGARFISPGVTDRSGRGGTSCRTQAGVRGKSDVRGRRETPVIPS